MRRVIPRRKSKKKKKQNGRRSKGWHETGYYKEAKNLAGYEDREGYQDIGCILNRTSRGGQNNCFKPGGHL